ncbi:MAG: hypothetical protein JNM39_17040 [Bdellovibrionaceae bacterium]|nr:hypothetical protein [Pseudobdellovibrionaceae bacterium]
MKSTMRKKENNSAVDDLLDSLLEDIDNSPSTSSGAHGPEGLPFSKNNHPPGMQTNDYDLEAPPEYSDNQPSQYDSEQRGFGDELQWGKLDIPELPQHYQTPEEVFGEAQPPAPDLIESSAQEEVHKTKHPPANNQQDETFALAGDNEQALMKSSGLPGASDVDPTVAVTAFAKKQKSQEPEEKVAIGSHRSSQKVGQVYTSVDASLAQAETLKYAQQRILQLEKDLERYRQENDELASAAEIIKARSDDFESKLVATEKEKNEVHDQYKSEFTLLKGSLQFKETELGKARLKIDELEGRMKSDFKKIRSKERELENRLELARAEKYALMRAKDDNILELQRKIDQIKSELSNYKSKVYELNKSIDGQNEQIRRTVRALRLALTSLEAKNDNIVPIKKAE